MTESFNSKTNKILENIIEIDKKNRDAMATLIRELGDHIAEGIKNKSPEAINLAKIIQPNSRNASEINERLVTRIIIRFKEKYFPTISDQWIRKCLPQEYKYEREETVRFDPNEITDRDLTEFGPEINKRFRKLMSHGPAKPFRFRDEKDMKKDNTDFPLKEVFLQLYENMLNDWLSGTLSNDVLEIIKHRLKTIADKRFAVSEMKYEAIILAVDTVGTLNNITKEETEKLSRWELFDRERDCKKCYGDTIKCRSEKCKCACHEQIKRLTPKGLKWAIEHSDHLKKLDDGIKKFSEWSDDICSIGKVILVNPHTKDHLSPTDAKKIMLDHIQKSGCEQCELYIDEHPDFFKEFK